MSAIAGVFNRRGAPRRPGEIDDMLAVMASRGPDGTSTWSNERVTLGYGALHATPESVHEQMPLVDRLTGNVIVADVRLDNRAELINKLGLHGRDLIKIGDGRLLLDAYRAWGEDCVDHLLGDFAFAIWDERRQRLFLARDHFGAKPLTYHSSERLFAFASDSRSILGLEDVPRVVNRDRVFDFLVEVTESVDTTTTFFKHAFRLPPANALMVSPADQRLRRFWNLPEQETLRLSSDGEYEEAAREILDLAVSCRLRGRDDVGVSLSGGIDSSSIAALMARRGCSRSYSAVSAETGCDETALIRTTSEALNLDSHEVQRSDIRKACGDFRTVHRSMESLFENGAMVRSVFAASRADGRRSVLTGVLADEVVAISPSIAMRTFLAERQPFDLVRLLMSNGNLRTQCGTAGLARSAILSPLTSSRRLDGFRTSRRRQRWNAWRTRFVDRLHLRATPEERLRLERRFDTAMRATHRDDGPGSLRQRLFNSGYASAALERYDREAATYSIECRTPFVDQRAVQFFQSLPAQQLVSGGWSKAVVRRSMEGLLPPQVCWNRMKSHLGWTFESEWLDLMPEHFLGRLPGNHPLFDFIDPVTTLRSDFGYSVPDSGRNRSLVQLALWLDGDDPHDSVAR